MHCLFLFCVEGSEVGGIRGVGIAVGSDTARSTGIVVSAGCDCDGSGVPQEKQNLESSVFDVPQLVQFFM